MSRFSYPEHVATSASVDETLDAARRALADLRAGPRIVKREVGGSLAGVEGRSRALCQDVLVQVVEGVESRLPPGVTYLRDSWTHADLRN